MRWSSIPIHAAQVLATLLALLLVCAPLCQPRACAHACCAHHPGDCQSGVDLTAALNCSRAVPSAAPAAVGARLLPALLLRVAPVVLVSECNDAARIPRSAHATVEPTPPLRI